jgi:hypothetical protein
MGPTSPLKNPTGSRIRLQEYVVGNYIATFIRLNKWLISPLYEINHSLSIRRNLQEVRGEVG